MGAVYLVLAVLIASVCLGIILAIVFIVRNHSLERERPSFKKRLRKQLEEETARRKETAGKEGEAEVANRCKNICRKYGGTCFNSFCFMDDKGYSSEIDHILITKGGVFVIETKNWSGIISGNSSDYLWKKDKFNSFESTMVKNPLRQNEKHIIHLKERFPSDPPERTSMVIFTNDDAVVRVKDTCLYHLIPAQFFLTKKIKEGQYGEDYVKVISEQFESIRQKYGITKEEHRKNIASHHKRN